MLRMGKHTTLTFSVLNVNGLGCLQKQHDVRDWISQAAHIAILADTRIPSDHNFWSQLRADTVVAATPSVRAGGVAIDIRNSEVSCTGEVCDASRRLARATLSWRGVVLTVVAAYFPSSPTARAPFFRDVLQPFISAIPAENQLMLAGDLNVVEDPALDKTSGAGSKGENDRLMTICSNFDVRDAFRALHPCLREYTFYAAAVQESTRIGRIPLSQSLLHQVHEVRHAELVKRFTDHWLAVHLKLSAGGDGESGPGLWRLPVSQAPCPGVRKRVEQIVRKNKERGGDLESLTASLRVGLKAYTVEERKRVAATTAHLGEAKLKAYEDGRRQKLQEQAGVKVEMNGEAPTGFMTAKIKARKARTRLVEVNYNGIRHEGAKEALMAASSFYTQLFAARKGPANSQLDWELDTRPPPPPEDAEELCAPWEEAEVKRALEEMARGKTPGRDGLPKELWEL
ncbi:unnamed protein product [Closterium sp. NIES-64]|nr:unnamed protein product [Closterium sp. NIES-64]